MDAEALARYGLLDDLRDWANNYMNNENLQDYIREVLTEMDLPRETFKVLDFDVYLLRS